MNEPKSASVSQRVLTKNDEAYCRDTMRRRRLIRFPGMMTTIERDERATDRHRERKRERTRERAKMCMNEFIY